MKNNTDSSTGEVNVVEKSMPVRVGGEVLKNQFCRLLRIRLEYLPR